MARTGVTYLEVAQAASTIQHQGDNPTIDAVRRVLGTGSNTTIAAHLKQWRAEHQPAAMALSNTTLPPELLSQMQSVWDALKAKSQESMEALKTEHEKQMAEHQITLQALTQRNTELEAAKQKREQENEALRKQLKESRDAYTHEQQNHQQTTAKLEEYKARLIDKETAIKDLKEQTQHIQQNLEHFHNAARQQREELVLQHDNIQSELKQEIKRLTHQLSEEREKSRVGMLEHEKQKYQAEKFADENQWLKNQSVERYELVVELKAQLKALQTQNTDLSQRCAAQADELTKQRNIINERERTQAEYKEKYIAAQATQSHQAKMIEYLSSKNKQGTLEKEQVSA